MTSCNDSVVPASPRARSRGCFQGIPYELGPVVGCLGVYAIVEWIRWNGAVYMYDGLTMEKTDKVSVSEQELIVPPGLCYKRTENVGAA